MKKKRLLSILLTLALVLGLMPGMSMTAFADGHTHNFEYTASGDTITATCTVEGCTLDGSKVTLKIGDPANPYYDDKDSSHEFTLEGLDAFNTATGKTISANDIVYYKGDNQSQDIKKNNVKGATYKARLTVEGVRAEHSFTFTAKPIVHTHSFNYTANGAVITATCTSTTGTCDLTNKQATLTLNAPEHTTYGDGKAANATFTGEIPGVTNPTINYRRSDTPLSSAPTDTGTYTAWCQLGNATASVEYTIGKATNNGWTTLPQAKQNLKYTGQPQALITAGTASAGSALYTVGTDPDNEPDNTTGSRPYTSSVPEMTNAGTYYVWCKIDGGNNYTSINAQKVEVTIARADITPSVSIVGWTYGETAKTPMVGDTANPGKGDVTYTYKVKDADDSTYKSTVPTAAGNYTIKAVIAETANYNSGVATKDFTISKAALTVTAKDQNISVGDKVPDLSSPVLDTHYTVTGLVGEDKLTTAPALAYQKNGNAATPDNTALGTYNIVASGASAGDNYTISYTTGTLTVEKGKAVAATVTANNRTYDGTEKPLVTVDNSTLVGGTMWYALGTKDAATGEYTTSIPAKTDAGTYYVWYKVVGDENHIGTDPAPVKVTISNPAGGGGTADAVQQVVDKINALPAPDQVTLNDEKLIKEAREAYDKLTDTQKQDSRLTQAIKNKLGDCETALEKAKKADEDQKAADNASKQIEALPAADKVTTADKAAIESARQAYDSLTDDQKKNVSEDTLKKLTDAEKALAAAQVKSVKTVTVNAGTINAKAVNKAVAKAGGSSKYVTTIVLGKKVKKISKGAFKNYKKAKTLVVKTKKLKKASVKKSLKGSKISKVKVKVSKKKKANKKYVKKYKKIFTKKNAGKKVKVSL